MDRLSGWYKRRTQVIIFCIGLVFAAAYNIDTIQVVNQLSRNNALRAALVSAAENVHQTGVPPGWSARQDASTATLADIRQPPGTFIGWVLKVLGLLLTGLAVSLGAPFWFGEVPA